MIGGVFLLALRLPAAAQSPRTIGVVIGIKTYIGDGLMKPVPYADNDAQLFDKYIGRTFDRSASAVLLNVAQSRLFGVVYELNRALTQARDQDTVCIFISARGVARPGEDGYIGTVDMVGSKPQSTTLPLRLLRQLIEQTSAARVILFADVARKPATPFDNQINLRLREFGTIRNTAVAGILASQPGQVSEERDQLTFRSEPPNGYGLFGYYLVSSGVSGEASVPSLYKSLSKDLPPSTQGKQKPLDFGSDRAKLAPIGHAAVYPWSNPARPGFRRLPNLLASLGPGWILAGESEQTGLQSIESELRSGPPFADPVLLADRILAMKPAGSQNQEWSAVRDLALMSLANEAQKYIDLYGMEDQLPGDPLQAKNSEFVRASIMFEAALKLVPEASAFRQIREMLRVRQLVCGCKSGQPGACTDLQKLNLEPPLRIPEADNVLGISYLESARDYPSAIDRFKNAKSAASAWIYPRHNLAMAYIELGNYSAAEKEYREAIAQSPAQPYLYYNLGLLLQRLNRTSEAKAAYRKAIDTYDVVIGELQSRNNEWKTALPAEARLALERVEVFRRNKAEVLNAWGSLLAAKHDPDGARKKYSAALGLNPDLCPAQHNLALLEQSLAEQQNKSAVSDVALDLFSRNLQRCPDFHPSRLKRALLELRKGQLAEARSDFAIVQSQAPENTEALAGAATVELRSGRYDAARALLTAAISVQIRQVEQGRREGTKSSQPAFAFPSLYVDLAEVNRKSGDEPACRVNYDLAVQASRGARYLLNKRELRIRANGCGNK